MRIESVDRGLALLMVVALVPGRSEAQSTEPLRSSPIRVELSAGAEVLPGLTSGTARSGRPFVASAAARWQTDAAVGIRAAGWWLRRGSESHFEGESYSSHADVTEQLFGVVLSGDLAWSAGPVTIGPSAGLGLAPRVTNRWHSIERGRSGPGTVQEDRGEVRSTGRSWTLGLALRVGHLVVEQHAVGLLGAERAVYESREFYPLTVGWRF